MPNLTKTDFGNYLRASQLGFEQYLAGRFRAWLRIKCSDRVEGAWLLENRQPKEPYADVRHPFEPTRCSLRGDRFRANHQKDSDSQPSALTPDASEQSEASWQTAIATLCLICIGIMIFAFAILMSGGKR